MMSARKRSRASAVAFSLIFPAYSRNLARNPPKAFRRAIRTTSRFNPSVRIVKSARAFSVSLIPNRGTNRKVPKISSPSGVTPPRSSSKSSVGSSTRGSTNAETPAGGGVTGSSFARRNSTTLPCRSQPKLLLFGPLHGPQANRKFDHRNARSGNKDFGYTCSISSAAESSQYAQRTGPMHIVESVSRIVAKASLRAVVPRLESQSAAALETWSE
nr:hypothetical protein HUO10_005103 [Paraburkholderia busanensis]